MRYSPTIMNQLHDLTHPVVRDLAWAVFSPNLISDFSFHPHGNDIQSFSVTLSESRVQWLFDLDHSPAALLLQLTALKSTRLGVYFEALWRFFIQHDPQYQLTAANLPISRHGTTLGEFDLIFYDLQQQRFIHLELATKYYLNTLSPAALQSPAGFAQLDAWLGPNCKDRLDIKLNRLLSHQARLSERPEAIDQLQTMGIAHSRKCIAIKGCLFYQQTLPGEKTLQDSPLNPLHWRGSWHSLDQLRNIGAAPDAWLILARHRWLSPARVDLAEPDAPRLVSPIDISDVLGDVLRQVQARPVMLCALNGTGSRLTETGRFMITPEGWPRREPG